MALTPESRYSSEQSANELKVVSGKERQVVGNLLTAYLALKNYWLAFLNLFYPNRCLSCKKELAYNETFHLCSLCSNSIQQVSEPVCVRCGVHLPFGGMHCFFCRKEKRYFTFVRSAGNFTGALREMVHQLKYSGKDYLSKELARVLLDGWKRYPELKDAEMVIPVPLHPSALRERGYNQAELLARSFVSLLQETPSLHPLRDGERIVKNVLVRKKKTQSQTLLNREERNLNVTDAFAVQEQEVHKIKGKIVLLIDDVCTTGATLNECAKVLKKAGAKRVSGLTLARD